jgi:hypothetical protein
MPTARDSGSQNARCNFGRSVALDLETRVADG